MTETPTSRIGPWLFTCVAGAVAGAVMGGLGASLHHTFGPARPPRMHIPFPLWQLGAIVGAVSGLAVGLGWCWLMRRTAGKLLSGVLYGLLAGLVCAAAAHTALMAASGVWKLGILANGLMFGVPSGLMAGLICAGVWQNAGPSGAPRSPTGQGQPRQ